MDCLNEEYRELVIGKRIFQVSNYGQVKEYDFFMKQYENNDGYLVVNAKRNAWVGVHRMVAMAFIPNVDPVNKREVNHLDFNRKNNKVNNLNWVSHEENIKYSAAHGRYVGKFGADNPNYGNTKLSKFYRENPEVAVEKQSRKGAQNGKARAIELYKGDKLISHFNYIGDCCEFLHKNYGFSSNPEVVRVGIRRSMQYNSPYKGFTFKKF